MITTDELTARLRTLENQRDDGPWPTEGIRLLGEAGCWPNVIARDFGGTRVAPRVQLGAYESIAAGSLTLALILTQHDGACELLGDCENRALAAELLPRCARGEVLTTVGLSQLTTSRRFGGPALRARPIADGYALDGVIPWVTSAPAARYIVTGAVLDDSRQVLLCVPTDLPGLHIGEPLDMMALCSSWTCEVGCEGVTVPNSHLLCGPTERVLDRRAAVKPLIVSAVGLGLAQAMLDEIRTRAPSLPAAAERVEDRILPACENIRTQLADAVDVVDAVSDPDAEIPSTEIRLAVNDLLVRLSVTMMTLAKGSGYVTSHPAQRLAREAMFFLVWAAPPQVQTGVIERMWP